MTLLFGISPKVFLGTTMICFLICFSFVGRAAAIAIQAHGSNHYDPKPHILYPEKIFKAVDATMIDQIAHFNIKNLEEVLPVEASKTRYQKRAIVDAEAGSSQHKVFKSIQSGEELTDFDNSDEAAPESVISQALHQHRESFEDSESSIHPNIYSRLANSASSPRFAIGAKDGGLTTEQIDDLREKLELLQTQEDATGPKHSASYFTERADETTPDTEKTRQKFSEESAENGLESGFSATSGQEIEETSSEISIPVYSDDDEEYIRDLTPYLLPNGKLHLSRGRVIPSFRTQAQVHDSGQEESGFEDQEDFVVREQSKSQAEDEAFDTSPLESFSLQIIDRQKPGSSRKLTASPKLAFDIATIDEMIGDTSTSEHQASAFVTTSRRDGSMAFGVASGDSEISRKSDTINESPDICRIAFQIFQESRSSLQASGLIEKVYRRIYSQHKPFEASTAAAFGVLSKEGMASLSVIKNACVFLFRNGVLINETHIKSGPGPKTNVTKIDDEIHAAGSSEAEYTFELLSDIENHEWQLQSGDVMVIGSSAVRGFAKRGFFNRIIENCKEYSAHGLAELLAEHVVRRVKRKQAKAIEGSLWNCLSCKKEEPQEFPTDVSLAVVKVMTGS